jgi:hypothetical protein
MSSRPSRVRKEPDTFLPTNFRGNETRKKAKTPAKTPAKKRKRQVVVKTPVDVKTLLNNISGPKSIKDGLLYMYKSKLTTIEAITKFITKRNNNELSETLKQQIGVIQQRHVPRISTNFNNVRSTNFNLNDDDKINLVYLIWLDVIHDGYISEDNLRFTNFMKSDMIKLLGFEISDFKMTPLIQKVKDMTGKTMFSYHVNNNNNNQIIDIQKMKTNKGLSLGYETILKRNLKNLFNLKSDIQEFSHDNIKFNKQKGKVVYVGIDQENSNQKSISSFVSKSKFTGMNGAKIKEYKQLQPYLTISNLTDPGVKMTMEGWGIDKVYLFPENKSKSPTSREAWNFRLQKFILGKTEITMIFNKENNVYKTQIKTQINNNIINTSSTAPAAKKASTPDIQVSKFLGDFLQALTMASYVNEPIALGTGDGMMAVIYCFLRKQLLKVEPKLVLDLSKGTKVQFIGLNNILQAKTSASEPTGVYINGNNMNNTAGSGGGKTIRAASGISGNSTIRGNNGSNGNSTIRGNNGSNGNNTIRANSGNSTNTNMTQPLRKKQKSQLFPNRNTLSIASAIRGTNNKKNNNEVTSGFAKMRNLKPKFVMGTKPKNIKKSPFPSTMYRRKVTKPQTTVLNPKRRPRNNNNNKLTPKKPKTNARVELNKLTSLSRNQKINYLEKIKRDPTNILRILNNARRVANSQRPPRQ